MIAFHKQVNSREKSWELNNTGMRTNVYKLSMNTLGRKIRRFLFITRVRFCICYLAAVIRAKNLSSFQTP